jgi:putative transposase
MTNIIRIRPRYPSDLSERQWARVSPLLPAERPRGRPRATAVREVLNAINYRWETGCVWRMLPHDFPPWGTVYTYFRMWQRQGVLREIREAVVRRDGHTSRQAPQRQPPKPESADRSDPRGPQTTESAGLAWSASTKSGIVQL